MKYLVLLIGVLLAVVSLPVGEVHAQDGLYVWVEDSLIKVRQNVPPPAIPVRSLELLAARGEMVAGQIVLKADNDLKDVTVKVTAPSRGTRSKAAIPYKVNFVGYVPVSVGNMFPDPLLPDISVSVKAGISQPIWVRFYPPVDAKPGEYVGNVAVKADGRKVTVPVALTVCNAVLPPGRSLKYFHLQNITCQFHQIDKRKQGDYQAQYKAEAFEHPLGYEGWKEKDWALVREMIKHQVAHRQNGFSLGFWDVIKIVKKGEKQYDFDFTWMDMYIDLITKEDPEAWFMGTWYGFFVVPKDKPAGWDWRTGKGARTEIATFWPTRIYKSYHYDGKETITAELDREIPAWTRLLDPEMTEVTDQMLPALQGYLRKKGIEDSYYLCVRDEVFPPESRSYVEVAKYIKSKAPSVMITDAIRTHQLEEGIDAWVPFVEHFDIRPDYYYGRRAAGDELWWYYCGNPGWRVNRAISGPLLQTRITHWLSFKYDFTGFLHWAYMIDYPAPNTEKPVGNGDGFVVYKGPNMKPLDSIRYEAILDSIEDYELLRVLEGRNEKAARELAKYVVEDTLHFTKDLAEFRQARKVLLQLCSITNRALSDEELRVVKNLERLGPMGPQQAERSTALDKFPWRLVYEDKFDADSIDENWERAGQKPRDKSVDWTVKDGWLTLPVDHVGDAILLSKKSVPGPQRLEYDCKAEFPANDLSALLAVPSGAGGNWRSGYFLGFGCEGNAFSKFCRQGAPLKWYAPVIIPDKVHHVVCEMDGNTIRHFIDGKKVLEYRDPSPLEAKDRDRVGFYIYRHGQMDNVKIFTR